MEDPFKQLKMVQRELWGYFLPVENMSIVSAIELVRFAEVKTGEKVLDEGCGTGTSAILAAFKGAQVKGIDLSPVLLKRGKENAEIAQVSVQFLEGDVEGLPYENDEFDLILSQFGHMFAPRPEVTVDEMLRVLRTGGRMAFTTWPADSFIGRLFSLVESICPIPKGVFSPILWGDPKTTEQRFDNRVVNLSFERSTFFFPFLSPHHLRLFLSQTIGPLVMVYKKLQENTEALSAFNAEFDTLISHYYSDNKLKQEYLLTKAFKR